jgi:hypothetical protein
LYELRHLFVNAYKNSLSGVFFFCPALESVTVSDEVLYRLWYKKFVRGFRFLLGTQVLQ